MFAQLRFGLTSEELDFPDEKLVGRFVGPKRDGDADVSEWVRAGLASPLDAPELYRACTPDDHVAIVLDPELPHATDILVPVLDSLSRQAAIDPGRIAIVHPVPSIRANIESLIEDLPDEFADLHVIEHRPNDHEAHSYLASTKDGRRVYLNRVVFDADFVLVVACPRFDATTGWRTPSSLLFPSLSTAETQALARRVAAEGRQAPESLFARQHCNEAAELAGLFYGMAVSIDSDGRVDQVDLGRFDSVQRKAFDRLEREWSFEPPKVAPDLVVAICSPSQEATTWSALGAALDAAARLVDENGRIAVVSDLQGPLGPAGEILRSNLDPWDLMRRLRDDDSEDVLPAIQFAQATASSKVFMLSRCDDDFVESLNVAPIVSMHELENLIDSAQTFCLLESADRVRIRGDVRHIAR